MPTWTIRRLDKAHDRSAFDCGQPPLSDWLKDRAGQFDRRDLSRTFVATRPDDTLVLGFYAISRRRVIYDVLPAAEAKGLPRLDVPVVLIGRLARITRTSRLASKHAFCTWHTSDRRCGQSQSTSNTNDLSWRSHPKI